MAGGTAPRKKQKRSPSARDGGGIPVGVADGGSGGCKGWSDLPELLLATIFDLLISLIDSLAFGGVCRSWRAFARSAVAGSSLAARSPPLLLRPVLGPLQLRPRCRKWLNPRRCTLESPTGESRQCLLSSPTLYLPFLGYSYGNLILIRHGKVLIADVFTCREILSPEVPRHAQGCDHGFLTAPPSSPDCSLLLSGSSTSLLCWRVGSDNWLGGVTGLIVPPLKQVLVFDHKVYALDSGERILTIQFSPQLSVVPLQPPLTCLDQQLVECGGELLMVCILQEHIFRDKFAVYRLEPSGADWTMIESLGDWSLFLDFAGRFSVLCINPCKWGGRSNCVYVVGPGCDNWMVYSMDGVIDTLQVESPFCPQHSILPRWPSPIWVYPSEEASSHKNARALGSLKPHLYV